MKTFVKNLKMKKVDKVEEKNEDKISWKLQKRGIPKAKQS